MLSGRITESISLFTYEPGKSYHDYQKLSFRPTFSLPSNLSPEVEELCGTDQECAFDYLVTDSADFAAETLHITEIFNTSVGASYESEFKINFPLNFICKFATRNMLPFKVVKLEFVPDDIYTNPRLNNSIRI